MKKLTAEVNDKIEITFYDHSSWASGWETGKQAIEDGDVAIKLIGYYVGETPVSYVFGMCYDTTKIKYGPVFNVIKASITAWHKVR